jgi:hypothetical protein
MELLALNSINQLREVTGQHHLKGYLFKLEMANRSTCKKHYDKEDTTIYMSYTGYLMMLSVSIL